MNQSAISPETQLEYKLIGSLLLLDGSDRRRILAGVSCRDFEDETAREIYQTLSGVCRKHTEADEAVLLSALTKEQQKTTIALLDTMMAPNIAKMHLDDTLAAMKSLANDRRLRRAVTELSISKSIQPGDIRQLSQLADEMGSTAAMSSAENYLLHYGDKQVQFSTGFSTLDDLLNGGFAAGTLATIGARPSTGKTTFVINIVSHEPSRKVLFFSLEMTSGMIYDRLVSDIADVEYHLAFRHRLPIETVRAVVEQYPQLAIVDNVADVETIVEMIYTERPEMVIIDFVQIITSNRRFVDNRQRIDYISQALKQAAKATGCCIITLSQLTRAGKDKPTMSDLKESGGLEQDCDYVILLHRPYVNDKSDEKNRPEDTTVILDKNKFGNTGELKFDFNGRRQRFTEEGAEEVARPAKVTVEDDLPF